MYTYLINEKEVVFNSNKERAEGLEAAMAQGFDIELVSEEEYDYNVKNEEETVNEEKSNTINKPGFLPDAAESADAVSETPAQDTELASEDISSASRYVRFKGGQIVYEKDYLANNSGQGDYPESFDEYAEKFGGVPQDLSEVTTEGGELDAVLLGDMGPEFYVTKEKLEDGRTWVNIDLQAIAEENGFEKFNDDLNKGETEVIAIPPADGDGEFDKPKFKEVKRERTSQEVIIKRQLIRAYDEGANLLFEGTDFADSNGGSSIFFEDKINKNGYLGEQAVYLRDRIKQVTSLAQAENLVERYNTKMLQDLKDNEKIVSTRTNDILRNSGEYVSLIGSLEEDAKKQLPPEGKEIARLIGKGKELGADVSTIRAMGTAGIYGPEDKLRPIPTINLSTGKPNNFDYNKVIRGTATDSPENEIKATFASYNDQARAIKANEDALTKAYEKYSRDKPWKLNSEDNLVVKRTDGPVFTDADGKILTPAQIKAAQDAGEELYANDELFDYTLKRINLLNTQEIIDDTFVNESRKNAELTAQGAKVFYVRYTNGSSVEFFNSATPGMSDGASFVAMERDSKQGRVRDIVHRKTDKGNYKAFTFRELANQIANGTIEANRLQFRDGLPEGFGRDKNNYTQYDLERKENNMMLPLVTDMKVLNIQPGSGGEVNSAKDYAESFFTSMVNATPGLRTNRTTAMEKNDAYSIALNKMGIDPNQTMKDAFTRSWGMRMAEGSGAFVPVIGEFGVAGFFTGGVGAMFGASRFIRTAFSGGRTLTNATSKARWANSFWGKHPTIAKFTAYAMKGMEEELKFYMIGPDNYEVGVGSSFYAGSLGASFISKFAKMSSKFKWAAPVNNVTQKTVLSGLIGQTASEVSHFGGALYKSLMDNKSLTKSIDELWGDGEEFMKRFTVGATQFGILGTLKLKNYDFMTEQKVQELNNKLKLDFFKAHKEGANQELLERLNQKIELTQFTLDQGKRETEKGNMRDLDNRLYTLKTAKDKEGLTRFERNNIMENIIETEKQKLKLEKEFEDSAARYKKIGITMKFGEVVGGDNADVNVKNKTIIVDKNKYSKGVQAHEIDHILLGTIAKKQGLLTTIYDNVNSKVEDAFRIAQAHGEVKLQLKAGKNLDANGNVKTKFTFKELVESYYEKGDFAEEYFTTLVQTMKNNRYFANTVLKRGVGQEIFSDLQKVARNSKLSFGEKPINLISGSKDNLAGTTFKLLEIMADVNPKNYAKTEKILQGVLFGGDGKTEKTLAFNEFGEVLNTGVKKSANMEATNPELKALRESKETTGRDIQEYYNSNKTTESPEKLANDLEFMFLDNIRFHVYNSKIKAKGGKKPDPTEVYEESLDILLGKKEDKSDRFATRVIMPFFRGQNIIAAIKRDGLSVEQTMELMDQGSMATGAKTKRQAAESYVKMATGEAPEGELLTYVNTALMKIVYPEVIRTEIEKSKYVATDDNQMIEYFANELNEVEGTSFSPEFIEEVKDAGVIKPKDVGYTGATGAIRVLADRAATILKIKPKTIDRIEKFVKDKIQNEPIEGLDSFSVGTLNIGGKIFDVDVSNQPNRATVYGENGFKLDLKGIRKPKDIATKLMKYLKKELTTKIIDQRNTPEQTVEYKKEMADLLSLEIPKMEKDPTRLFKVSLEREAEAEFYEDIRAEMGELGSVENVKWLAKARTQLENYIDLSQITKRFDLDVLYEKVYKTGPDGKPLLNSKGQPIQARSSERASGVLLFKKKNISAKDFLDYFSNSAIRQESLAKAFAREFAFDKVVDIVKSDIIKKISIKSGTEITQVDLTKGSEIYKADMFKHIRRGEDITELYKDEIMRSADMVGESYKVHNEKVKKMITRVAGGGDITLEDDVLLTRLSNSNMEIDMETMRELNDKASLNTTAKKLETLEYDPKNLSKAEFEKRTSELYGAFKEIIETFPEAKEILNVSYNKTGDINPLQFFITRVMGANDLSVGRDKFIKDKESQGVAYNVKDYKPYDKGPKTDKKGVTRAGGRWYSMADGIKLWNESKYKAGQGIEGMEKMKADTQMGEYWREVGVTVKNAVEKSRNAFIAKEIKYNGEKRVIGDADGVRKLYEEVMSSKSEQKTLTREEANKKFIEFKKLVGEEMIEVVNAEADAMEAIQKAVLYSTGMLKANTKLGGAGEKAVRTFMTVLSNNSRKAYRKLSPEIWFDFNTYGGKIKAGNEHLKPRAEYFRRVYDAFKAEPNSGKFLTDPGVIDAIVGGYESMLSSNLWQSLGDSMLIPSGNKKGQKANSAPIPFLAKMLIASTPGGKAETLKAWNRAINGKLTMADLIHLDNIKKLDGTSATQQWGKDLLKRWEETSVKESVKASFENKKLAEALGLESEVNGTTLLKEFETERLTEEQFNKLSEQKDVYYHGTSAEVNDTFISTEKAKDFAKESTSFSTQMQGLGKHYSKSNKNAQSFIDHRSRKNNTGTVAATKITSTKPKVFKTYYDLLSDIKKTVKDKSLSIEQRNKLYLETLEKDGFDSITYKEGPSYNPSKKSMMAEVVIPFNSPKKLIGTAEYQQKNGGMVEGSSRLMKSKDMEAEGKSYVEVKEKKQSSKDKILEGAFADMIERKGGAPADARVSDSKAFMAGKKRFDDIHLPSSSEDLQGLMYKPYGKGKQGDADMEFMNEHIFRPLTKAENALSVYRMKLAEDYAGLERQIKEMGETKPEKEAAKRVDKLGYNIDQAVRVYIWSKLGMKIPGISVSERSQLLGAVASSKKLRAYADGIMNITKTKEKYPEPKENWFRSNVQYDLFTHATDGVRADFLYEWQENVDAIFTKENLNKLEARFGGKYRYNLEQMLKRIQVGKSRPESTNEAFNTTLNYINGSVATIMFLNMRSAALQTISAANYINWTDNNPIAVAKVIGKDPKAFIETAKKIWSSDALRDRRTGLKINVQEAEMAKAIRQGGRTAAQGIWDQMVQIGFKPTQMADSFAIVMGGTPFYMNRMKTYEKEGMNKNEAADKAWEDFLYKTQEGQQSSQMDRVSNIQTGLMGRLVFSFNNTPFQMSRLQKKAFLDLKNNRGDKKTNVSRMAYYGLVQSSLFYGLQQAFYGSLMSDDADLSEKELGEKYKDFEKRLDKMGKSVWQGILSGSGLPGKGTVVAYNTVMEARKQYNKGYQGADFFPILSQIMSLSPTLGSKVNRLGRNWKSLIMAEHTKKGREFGNTFDAFDPRNPNNKAYISMIGTATNIPVDRLITKMENISDALDANNELWQRAAMIMGTPKYQLQTKEQNTRDRENIIEDFYIKNTPKAQRDLNAIEMLTIGEQNKWMRTLGVNNSFIKQMQTQSDRTRAILYFAKELDFDIEKEYSKYDIPAPVRSPEYKKLQEIKKDGQIEMLRALGVRKWILDKTNSEEKRIELIMSIQTQRKNSLNSLK